MSEKPRRGRPIKPQPRGRKRVQISLIIDTATKTRMDKEAKDSGRTVSQVGEWLIEKALTVDDVLRGMGRTMQGIARENLEAEMLRQGWAKHHDSGRVMWLPPERSPVERSGFIEWSEEDQSK